MHESTQSSPSQVPSPTSERATDTGGTSTRSAGCSPGGAAGSKYAMSSTPFGVEPIAFVLTRATESANPFRTLLVDVPGEVGARRSTLERVARRRRHRDTDGEVARRACGEAATDGYW